MDNFGPAVGAFVIVLAFCFGFLIGIDVGESKGAAKLAETINKIAELRVDLDKYEKPRQDSRESAKSIFDE